MDQENAPIGIDLGTTNSCVAVIKDGQVQIIKNRSGYTTTPSIVAFTAQGQRIVGQLAKRQSVINANSTVYASKRLLGRHWDSPFRERMQELIPYHLTEGPHKDIRIRIGDAHYSPAEIASVILSEIKMVAEEALGRSVKHAVITVPAYFTDMQRQATKDAGRMAGLDVLRIINEPTAAALSYGLDQKERMKIAIYDLGGGTFDVSILDLNKGVFEVISTAGDTFLGGEDFDHRIIEWLVFDFAKEHKLDLRKDPVTLQRLKESAEKAKHTLSETTEAEINLPFLITDKDGNTHHLLKILTREKFEALTDDLIERTIQICKSTLSNSLLKAKNIDEVILVGGMTRVPKIQKAVSDFFGRPPSKNVHPDEVVALGAAIQGSALLEERTDILLLDVTPHSLGIMIAGGYYQVLIEQNTTVPCTHSHIFTTVKDYQVQVKLLVLQGESSKAEENELLGEFTLDGLRAAPRGEVQIEVKFSISADGIVSVSARDLETKQETSIIVTVTSRLSEEEMMKMIEENIDYTLEAKTSEEFLKQKATAERDLQHIESLFPQVKLAVQDSAFGLEALDKAKEIGQRAHEAIENEDLPLLISIQPALQRTRKIFSQILERTSKGQ